MAGVILIVEDNQACATTLELALFYLSGIETLVARTADEALEVLDTGKVSVRAMVTDLHLPLVDGYDLIARVRAHPRLGTLPIVVISGDTDPGNAARLRLLGVDAYFVKPYSPAAVRRRLEEILAT